MAREDGHFYPWKIYKYIKLNSARGNFCSGHFVTESIYIMKEYACGGSTTLSWLEIHPYISICIKANISHTNTMELVDDLIAHATYLNYK